MPLDLTAPERVSILGLPLDLVDLESTVSILRDWARASEPGRTLITLNPEIVVQSATDAPLRSAIEGADLVTADGVGKIGRAHV